jgi:4-amino-4-deoxy-L-arabinose transferase-like glycosyltransferase
VSPFGYKQHCRSKVISPEISNSGDSALSPQRGMLFIILLWAAIYLPGLGSVQLEHEEPRRALPGIHMLASGDWLVPRVGSEPYLRKPPLLNWAIALSCKLAGGVSELAVRLPSVIATVMLSVAIFGIAGPRWLGRRGGLIAAIFFLVNFTMIETGRLAELEALYVSLTGIALILWMTSWRNETGPWQLWLLPAPFLALGMLTKGPTHLIFYYGIIFPVLLIGKNTRSLLHPAHFLSLIVIFAPLLCWAVPCSLAVSGHYPAGVWKFWWGELASRASAESDEHFRLAVWLLNGPQTLKNYLPWTLLLPLLWRKETVRVIATAGDSAPRDLALFRGARWGMVATTVLMILLPNGSPRYIYPLIVVPCLLLGRALTAENGAGVPVAIESLWRPINLVLLAIVSIGVAGAPFVGLGNHIIWTGFEAILVTCAWVFALSRKRGTQAPGSERDKASGITTQAALSGVIAAIGVMIFATGIMPRVDSANKYRPREVARTLRAAMPAGTTLWVLERSYRPFWYYLEPDVRYFNKVSDLPAAAQFILLPAAQSDRLLRDLFWRDQRPKLVAQATDNEMKSFDLFVRSK